MRGSASRRWIRIVSPTSATTPAMPPPTIDRYRCWDGVMNSEEIACGDQEAEEMTEEHHQDAEVEQVRAPPQLALPQELRRVAFPGVLVAVEAREAAEQEHGERDVRIDAEEELVQPEAEVIASLLSAARPATAFGLRRHETALPPSTRLQRPEVQTPARRPIPRRSAAPAAAARRHLLQSRPGQFAAMDSTAASTAA